MKHHKLDLEISITNNILCTTKLKITNDKKEKIVTKINNEMDMMIVCEDNPRLVL